MASEEEVEGWKANSDFRKTVKLAHKNSKRAREMAQGCLASGEITSEMAEYLFRLMD